MLSMIIKTLIRTCILWLVLSTVAWGSCVGLGCNCTVASTSTAFGLYDAVATSPNETSSTISVTCGALVLGGLISYQIRLSKGNSTTYVNRKLINGVNPINYNIYADAGRTQIWGDTTEGTVEVTDSYLLSLLSTTRQYTAFGRIPTGQFVPSGTYNDTIVVTIIF